MTVPAPRPAPEQPQPVPFRLPWQVNRPACRPVIGDALLLEFPEIAKALAEDRRSNRHPQADVGAFAAGGGA